MRSNVDETESFWKGERYRAGDVDIAEFVRDDGNSGTALTTNAFETVCVTTPTN